ncbi:MAG: hypothetical protein MPL62_06265 [Alphaproteobacteria bacterium]|nr:hypothetical protein [Alphaproteobacteria bacterium]
MDRRQSRCQLNRRAVSGISGRWTKTFTMFAQANRTNLSPQALPAKK